MPLMSDSVYDEDEVVRDATIFRDELNILRAICNAFDERFRA